MEKGWADPVLLDREPFGLGEPMPVVMLEDEVRISGQLDVVLPIKVIPADGGGSNQNIGVPIEEATAKDSISVHVERVFITLLMPVAESLFAKHLGLFPFVAQKVDPAAF